MAPRGFQSDFGAGDPNAWPNDADIGGGRGNRGWLRGPSFRWLVRPRPWRVIVDCDGPALNEVVEVGDDEAGVVGEVDDVEAEPSHLGAKRLLSGRVCGLLLAQERTQPLDLSAGEVRPSHCSGAATAAALSPIPGLRPARQETAASRHSRRGTFPKTGPAEGRVGCCGCGR